MAWHLAPVLLYYITDSRTYPARFTWLLDRVLAAARAGVDYIQLREKDLSARQLVELAGALRRQLATVPGCRARLLINDRLDVALAAGAHGVHLPAAGLPVAAVTQIRSALPPGFLIVASCHSAAEVAAATRAGADAAVLGPIYATPSKAQMGEPLGLEPLRAASLAPMPVIALGGVTLARAGECLAAGARGLAGIRLFQDADPAATCAALRAIAAKR